MSLLKREQRRAFSANFRGALKSEFASLGVPHEADGLVVPAYACLEAGLLESTALSTRGRSSFGILSKRGINR